MSRLVLTGATGNTGGEVLRRLLERLPGRPLLALVRPSTDTRPLDELGVPHHACDLGDPGSYRAALRPGDSLLEMANLRHARAMLAVFRAAGAERAYCVTTTGVFSAYHSYSALYREIEEEMRRGPLPVTILRPSMIYGNERDHNMHKLLRFLDSAPAFPVFGAGTALMQPVHVSDLAAGIVAAVELGAPGEYNLAGPEPQPYNSILADALSALGRRVPLFHLPQRPVAWAVSLGQRLPGFPVKPEQVMRLAEDKDFDIGPSRARLGYAPRPFRQGIAEEVARLRALGRLRPARGR